MPTSVRRSLLAVLLTVVAATATASEQLPGILGSDDRVIIDRAEWPWTAIGRVNWSGGGFCTGTLIAARLVLTAAHCVFDRAGRRLSPRTVHFVGGYRRGTAATHARAGRIITSDDFQPRATPSLERISNDWALIVLATPIATPPVPVRPLPTKTRDSRTNGDRLPPRLLTAGYAQDRPHLLSLHANCAISKRIAGDDVLLHTCDATRGSSGSPLILDGPDGLHVVGILAGTLDTESVQQSFAVHVRAFIEPLNEALADAATR